MTKKFRGNSATTRELKMDLAEQSITGSPPQKELLKQLKQVSTSWETTDEGNLWINWPIVMGNPAPQVAVFSSASIVRNVDIIVTPSQGELSEYDESAKKSIRRGLTQSPSIDRGSFAQYVE